jgi:AraC-like DNA-binding protein
LTKLVDPLSDLLRVVRLDGAYFYGVEGGGAWQVGVVPARELSPAVLPASEHLISYHILTEGRCFGGLVDGPKVELAAGDAIIFPHGHAHTMASGADGRADWILTSTSAGPFADVLRIGERGGAPTTFVCGFLGCDRRPFNPLLAALPPVIHMRGITDGWTLAMISRLTEESRQERTGSVEVVIRLAELMFIEALRRYLDRLGPEQTGWLAGLRDEVVGRALSLLHGSPAHSWTLAELARESNSSRTRLAHRFTSLVGQPPMQYLTRWRMQVAARRLLDSGDKVATVGAQVGYDSEAAFSRAFKQATGHAPGAWRRIRRQSHR